MFLVEMEQNMENSKKLSFSQRITIENLLNQRKRKFEIANELDKSPSKIRETIIIIIAIMLSPLTLLHNEYY